ncbi:class I SAM-dependent methyltransferase [Acuticoccus sediminis]|nr:class I SAM-dependent methyltransferase [Acuticoccus sediminis]
MMSRARRRTISFGLQTVLGIRQKGYFIPMRHAVDAVPSARRPFEALRSAFTAAEPAIAAHLDAIEAHRTGLEPLAGPPPEPRFDQIWCPRLDAAALYALVRTARPERIVEVGSGHSTRFLWRAVRDEGLGTRLTAIDPQPRADLAGLPIELIRKVVQAVDPAPFHALRAGDVLFVDSSHVLMPGTDVDLVLNHILPTLPAGVLVAFHDIFLPAPYPDAWPFTSYNEQNAIAPLLQGRAEIVWASAYAVAEMGERLARTWIGRQPLKDGARESLIVLRLR